MKLADYNLNYNLNNFINFFIIKGSKLCVITNYISTIFQFKCFSYPTLKFCIKHRSSSSAKNFDWQIYKVINDRKNILITKILKNLFKRHMEFVRIDRNHFQWRYKSKVRIRIKSWIKNFIKNSTIHHNLIIYPMENFSR